MIDKVNFASCIQEMALLLGVEASGEWLKAMYKHIGNYFNDDEFKLVCHKIMTNNDLYGKMPTVRDFMKYAIKEDDERLHKKTEFLNKVSDYLELDFVSQWDKEQFFKDMTELEYRTLQSAGGISELWRRVHNLDYPANVSTIRKELSTFYDDNYMSQDIKIALERRESVGSIGDIAKKLLERK
jgi:hypothetical protein